MLNEDFKEMLKCLNEEQTEYLLIGAYALAVHGFPRATGDIDLWVRPSAENAERVMKALKKFGAPLFNVTVEDFLNPATIYQIGVRPRRIVFITSPDPLFFEDCMEKAIDTLVDDIPIKVLSVSDMIKNKEATGRPKDHLDAQELRKRYDVLKD